MGKNFNSQHTVVTPLSTLKSVQVNTVRKYLISNSSSFASLTLGSKKQCVLPFCRKQVVGGPGQRKFSILHPPKSAAHQIVLFQQTEFFECFLNRACISTIIEINSEYRRCQRDIEGTLACSEQKNELNIMNTHSHIHHVSPGLRTGQHGGHTCSGSVVGVNMDGHIWETVPESADQKLAGLGLQQAGHILETKRFEEETRGGELMIQGMSH